MPTHLLHAVEPRRALAIIDALQHILLIWVMVIPYKSTSKILVLSGILDPQEIF
jgi:hypothetical protein